MKGRGGYFDHDANGFAELAPAPMHVMYAQGKPFNASIPQHPKV